VVLCVRASWLLLLQWKESWSDVTKNSVVLLREWFIQPTVLTRQFSVRILSEMYLPPGALSLLRASNSLINVVFLTLGAGGFAQYSAVPNNTGSGMGSEFSIEDHPEGDSAPIGGGRGNTNNTNVAGAGVHGIRGTWGSAGNGAVRSPLEGSGGAGGGTARV
jgi:hypothetical protein